MLGRSQGWAAPTLAVPCQTQPPERNPCGKIWTISSQQCLWKKKTLQILSQPPLMATGLRSCRLLHRAESRGKENYPSLFFFFFLVCKIRG